MLTHDFTSIFPSPPQLYLLDSSSVTDIYTKAALFEKSNGVSPLKHDVMWRRCFHPRTLAPILTLRPSSAPPASPLAQPSSPLLSSPPLLPGCVSQDQRSIQRSSRWRSAGKRWNPTDITAGKGAQVREARVCHWNRQSRWSCHYCTWTEPVCINYI